MNTGDRSYTQTGGARLGLNAFFAFNFTAPFAKITIGENKIALEIHFFIFKRKYEFKRDHVTRIQDYDGLLSKGIKIDHKNGSYPTLIIFWTPDRTELNTRLRNLDYPIQT